MLQVHTSILLLSEVIHSGSQQNCFERGTRDGDTVRELLFFFISFLDGLKIINVNRSDGGHGDVEEGEPNVGKPVHHSQPHESHRYHHEKPKQLVKYGELVILG